MLPPMFVVLLVAFGDCLAAPSYENFCRIVAGWVHCLGGHGCCGQRQRAPEGGGHLSEQVPVRMLAIAR